MKKLLVLGLVLAFVGAVQAEMLTANRGFEVGDMTDWLQYGGGSGGSNITEVINDGTAYEGDYYIRVGRLPGDTTWGFNVVWQGEAPTPLIPASPLTGYHFQGQVRSTDTGAKPLLKLEWFPAEGGKISEEEIEFPIVTDGTWQLIQADYVSPEGTDYIRAVIGVAFDEPPSFVVDYDDLSLTPEPATLALLGLGGLFLRRRK